MSIITIMKTMIVLCSANPDVLLYALLYDCMFRMYMHDVITIVITIKYQLWVSFESLL